MMAGEKKMDGARFAQLVLSGHARMRMLVLSIAPGCQDVDDIVQEACAAMWQKIDDYDADRKFLPWALAFVRFQTLAWLKSKGRDRLRFDDGLVDRLCQAIASDGEAEGARTEALELCLEGLSESDRELMALRYVDGMKVAEIAQKTAKQNAGRSATSADSLYKTFAKLKASLLRCVRSRMEETGHVAS